MTDGGRYPSVVLMCILLTLGVSYAIPAVLYDNVSHSRRSSILITGSALITTN